MSDLVLGLCLFCIIVIFFLTVFTIAAGAL